MGSGIWRIYFLDCSLIWFAGWLWLFAGSSSASVGWGPWSFPLHGYLHEVICASSKHGGWVPRESVPKGRRQKLTGQLRATSRGGIALLRQTHILPLYGGVAWSHCRRPHAMGDVILAIFGKYSLSHAALLMKLHKITLHKRRKCLESELFSKLMIIVNICFFLTLC